MQPARSTSTNHDPLRGAGDAQRRADVEMTWDNLLFLHWRVDADAMRALLPSQLELDLYDSAAWIALVPFQMRACEFRGVPRLPGTRDFFECNVRTYVRHAGKSGVWFFSLDAQTMLPVIGGRQMWNLNYVWSRFDVRRDAGTTDYRLKRRNVPGLGDGIAAQSHIVWTPGERLPLATPGSLEHFLTERYWLFTLRARGSTARVMAGQVEHAPWSLRRAAVDRLEDTLIQASGVRVSGAPLALASDTLRVRGYGLIPSVEGS
jgi:uncharacterized protein YqjF (DUF2071 family)